LPGFTKDPPKGGFFVYKYMSYKVIK
jgi:hypothetical protein